jgi:1-acyl-sn-glycerol-3-phosphate acyltransferase
MGIPVVPIALCGTGDAMEKKRLTLNRQTIELRIGKPLNTKIQPYDSRNEFVADVRERIMTLKEGWRNAS